MTDEEKEAIEYCKYQTKTGNLIRGYTDYYYLQRAIETVLNLIEKKDKIIDKMVEKLSYVEDLKLDVCVNCKEDCRIPRNQGDCIKTGCIKEYFKKKVEDK